jgi:hypothetical protein
MERYVSHFTIFFLLKLIDILLVFWKTSVSVYYDTAVGFQEILTVALLAIAIHDGLYGCQTCFIFGMILVRINA